MSPRPPETPALTGNASRVQTLLLAGVLLALALVLSLDTLRGGETWLSLATGREILAGGIPREDTFSHTRPGAPWIVDGWLGCVLLALAAQAGGPAALVVLRAAVILGVIAGWLMLCRRRPGALWGIALTAPLALALAPLFLVRPALFTSLLIVWQFVLVDIALRDRRRWPLWLLPLVCALGVNLSSHAVFGLAFLAIYLAGLTLQGALRRREDIRDAGNAASEFSRTLALWPWLLAAAVALLLNPYGPWAPLQPLRTLGGWVARMSPEHRSTLALFQGDSALALVSRLVTLALGLMAAWAAAFSRMNLGANLLMVPLAAAAAWRVGFVVDAAFLAVALIGPALGETLASLVRTAGPRRAAAARWILTAAGLFAALGIGLLCRPVWSAHRSPFRPDPASYPAAAMDFLAEHRPFGQGFHPLDWGGALRWHLGAPNTPGGPVEVYADGRLEVYGLPFLAGDYGRVATAALDEPTWRTILDARGVNWILISPRGPAFRPLAEALYRRQDSHNLAERDWALVHFDDHALLFFRRAALDGAHGADLALGFRADPAWAREQSPGLFRNHPEWIATLLRMIDEQPGNRTAVELLLAMEQAMGSTEHRALALERLLTFDLETPVRAQTEHALGLLHYNQGNAASALPHFERAVELEPEAIPIREAHAAALWMLHREAETVAAYQAILELDPRNAQAREALREHEAGTLWDEAPPPPIP